MSLYRILVLSYVGAMLVLVANSNPSFASPEETLEIRAQSLYQQKKWDELVLLLQPQTHRLSTRELSFLAEGFRVKKQALDEVRVLELILGKSERNARIWNRLGEVNLELGYFDKAVSNFRSAISVSKKYRLPYEGLKKIFLEKKKSNYELREVLKDMVEVFGKEKTSLALLCRSYFEDGYMDQTRGICREARKLDPANPDNGVYLGLSLLQVGEEASGLKWLEESSRRFKSSEFAQWALAQYHFERKNIPAAHEFYILATKADPSAARSQKGLALASFELKKYEQSEAAFRIACKQIKGTLQDVKTAVAKLKREGNSVWVERFQALTSECL